MKKEYVFSMFMLLVVGLFTFSCDTPKSSAENTEEVTPVGPTISDTISKQRFINWVTDWKSDGLQFSMQTLPEFFTMPTVDLKEVLKTPGVKQSRFYLGLDTSHPVDSLHLIIVGVDQYGNDMLDYQNGQYAYDVTKLCPILCGGGYGYPANLNNN